MRWYLKAIGPRKIVEFIILVVFVIFFLGPLLNLAILAFTGKWTYPDILPHEWSLKWWTFVLQQEDIAKSIGLSFMIASIVTALSIVLCIPAAYAFARIRFPLSRFFLFSFLLTHAFPKMGLYVSIAVLFYKLGLMNTLIGVVLIHMINVLMFMTWIPTAAFRNVHTAQEESARDVGASPFRVFRSITLPMAMPGIIVASIFTFLNSLDEAQGTFLVGIPNYKTMPIVMYSIISDYPAYAGAVFSIILTAPTIILLLAAQRFVSADIMSSGFQLK
ncbi:putative spermidine/putrescine transport system permease protein [Paenibacillus sp. V4I3]|jgi:putative spermidine/putrescine transport system permease protein|uniref:ABC transporter permease n=1 Tax=Paenibacillus TaxID=44249 RepID=UPI0004000AB3|nr:MULTISPECIES: ABC transporter permease subunit [Paenibacillus]MCY9668353.1 ABC transporter permease subunit [Paenibacillus alginolyticus]MDQ0874735.1 putative spermidine/putrescine transport system permease protein [Paenibacillus sp. V4I3]MDQ0889513.1 putative spermidine/putrescine transport system permease protein [Paenibacillus sp. V4I9]